MFLMTESRGYCLNNLVALLLFVELLLDPLWSNESSQHSIKEKYVSYGDFRVKIQNRLSFFSQNVQNKY